MGDGKSDISKRNKRKMKVRFVGVYYKVLYNFIAYSIKVQHEYNMATIRVQYGYNMTRRINVDVSITLARLSVVVVSW